MSIESFFHFWYSLKIYRFWLCSITNVVTFITSNNLVFNYRRVHFTVVSLELDIKGYHHYSTLQLFFFTNRLDYDLTFDWTDLQPYGILFSMILSLRRGMARWIVRIMVLYLNRNYLIIISKATLKTIFFNLHFFFIFNSDSVFPHF